ncbi:MAG: hypothetical protein JNL83_18750 [Myxococcales bacterium]|nr:hypothetical protein [Myxococcales bacterium]
MQGDIALAGFVLTAEEWKELDATSRAQLVYAAMRRDEPLVAGAAGSGPIQLSLPVDPVEPK